MEHRGLKGDTVDMGFDLRSVVESIHDLEPGEQPWLQRLALLSVGCTCAVAPLDPDETLSRWRAMAEGDWTPVEAVERDGRRYLVARRSEAGRGRRGGLSPREREVATYAARGMGIREVAAAMGLSSSTVGTHLASAMRKLKVRTRAELATMLGAVGEVPP
jgi:DNA-binding NarL/FixJ family response regulator